MAFTGRLGTDDSQLGNIELGSEGQSGLSTTESISTSESISRNASMGRAITDASSIAESVVRAATSLRSSTDSLSLSESVEAAFTKFGSFALDSVLLKIQTASISLDALVVPPTVSASFSVDATVRATQTSVSIFDSYIIGSAHSRLTAHFGTQDDTVITVGSELLSDVLARMFGAAYGIVQPNSRFGIDAFIQPYLYLEAVLTKAGSSSFGIDARIGRGGTKTLNAVIKNVPRYYFSLNAYILPGNTQPGPNTVSDFFGLFAEIV